MEEEQMNMPRTTLGRTGLEISRVGLGAWAIGGGECQGGWGAQDDEESIAAIHHAIERGINWVDTAPAYGMGHAEEVVGRAIAALPPADRPLVFTKCGLVWGPGERTVSNVLSPTSIRAECDASLRRLGTDHIDLYQIHWPGEDGTPLEESWATMVDLVSTGKVGHIGVSNFTVDLLEACEAVRPVESFQPELNLLNRSAADATIPWCDDRDVGVIVYSPMASGLLTGRFTTERVQSLPEDDWRRDGPFFQEPELSRGLALVDRLAPIAARRGCTVPELAVAWVLAWPGVDGAIVGARNPEQVDGWIDAPLVTLDDGDRTEIADAVLATGAGAGPAVPSAA
jgi:aryl-alcohol dehydrogenase-like predicted oxidoreductase